MTTIVSRLNKIRKLIAQYEQQYQRQAGSVQLLVATKGQPIEVIKTLYSEAEQCVFGESYVQEALPKIIALSAYPEIQWHFLGPIQSNKTRKIAEHFSFVHSVCSKKIASRLNEQRPAHLPPLQICLEVNVSEEASKSGVTTYEEIRALAKYCLSLPQLKLRGLMAIPAPSFTLAKQRSTLHALFILWQALIEEGFSLDTLSMGMSADLEAAIAEGSTMLRIGSGIFNPRILP